MMVGIHPHTVVFLPLAYNTPLKYFFYFKEEPLMVLKMKRCVAASMNFTVRPGFVYSMENSTSIWISVLPFDLLLYQLQKLVKHLGGRLPRILPHPVQLIQAKHDDMSSERNSHFIYNKVKSARKELVFLHNSYHIITADQERNTVAMHMQRFFANNREL